MNSHTKQNTTNSKVFMFASVAALLLMACTLLLWIFNHSEEESKPETLIYPINLSAFIDSQGDAPTQLEKQALESLLREYEQLLLSDEYLKSFYESDENQLTDRKAQVAHILLATRPDTPMEERKAKYQQAMSIYQQANAGQDFGMLARQYSDDKLTSHEGGKIGWIVEKQLGKEFDRHAFERLKPNQVSKPFQSKFGFHILKLLSAPVEARKPFQEVKPRIKAYLAQRFEQEKKELMTQFSLQDG